jgi:hypothetical protein
MGGLMSLDPNFMPHDYTQVVTLKKCAGDRVREALYETNTAKKKES